MEVINKMVEVDFSGNFLNAENCKENDVGVIIDEGKLKERTSNGNTWNQLTITVEVNEKQFSHSFRSQEGKRFQETFGADTKTWVGKKFSVIFIPYVDKNDNNKIKQGVEIYPKTEDSQVVSPSQE